MNLIFNWYFEIKGKNVFDPRTNANATTDLQRSNPALIIRDYLTNERYGKGIAISEIDLQSFYHA